MKKTQSLWFLLFIYLSGTTVYAQNSQTGVKKEITKHSKNLDDLEGKKIQQQSLSTNYFEKLDTTTKVVKTRFQDKKPLYKKKKKKS